MALETTQEITLRLPTELVQRIEQVASQGHQPVEDVVTEVLEISLPPLRQKFPPPSALANKFQSLSETDLKQVANSWFPEDAQNRLDELLTRNREGVLSATENNELESLLDQMTMHAAESAAAKWILKNTTAR